MAKRGLTTKEDIVKESEKAKKETVELDMNPPTEEKKE